MPKWATPNRQAQLVKLFVDSGGFCVFGHRPCQGQGKESYRVVCAWGRKCHSPVLGLCRYKPEEPHLPHLPCQFYLRRVWRWTCEHGQSCAGPFASHYGPYSQGLIADWQADDRQARLAEAQAEARALHGLAERGPMRGRFSKVSRDVFFGQQPRYYLEGLGISGLTFKPFAKVRLGSSFVRLHVDLADSLRSVGKVKKRKALRYGKGLPIEAQAKVDQLCRLAVRDFLK